MLKEIIFMFKKFINYAKSIVDSQDVPSSSSNSTRLHASSRSLNAQSFMHPFDRPMM